MNRMASELPYKAPISSTSSSIDIGRHWEPAGTPHPCRTTIQARIRICARKSAPQADRPAGRVAREPLSRLAVDEPPDTGDPEADREAQRWRQGKAQRAVGLTFRMTRPLKRPMRVALPGALQGFNPYASQSQPSAASRFSVVNTEAHD